MFSKTAQYYDKIYSFKNYQAEVKKLISITNQYQKSDGKRWLDVACGTGQHIRYLKEHFSVQGLDISEELLGIAQQLNPTITFHQADMMDFQLQESFDVVSCLFSSIGYLKTLENVERAIQCMAGHLVPGGILIIEPWFTPDTWHPGTVHAGFIDEPDLKIARINTSFVDGRLSYFDFHYLIGTPEKTEYFVERHELGLFETEEILAILEKAGLNARHDPEGLTGRGLLLGSKTISQHQLHTEGANDR